MNRKQNPCTFLLVLIGIIVVLISWAPQASCKEAEAMIIDLEGAINPATATFMSKGIEEAEKHKRIW